MIQHKQKSWFIIYSILAVLSLFIVELHNLHIEKKRMPHWYPKCKYEVLETNYSIPYDQQIHSMIWSTDSVGFLMIMEAMHCEALYIYESKDAGHTWCLCDSLQGYHIYCNWGCENKKLSCVAVSNIEKDTVCISYDWQTYQWNISQDIFAITQKHDLLNELDHNVFDDTVTCLDYHVNDYVSILEVKKHSRLLLMIRFDSNPTWYEVAIREIYDGFEQRKSYLLDDYLYIWDRFGLIKIPLQELKEYTSSRANRLSGVHKVDLDLSGRLDYIDSLYNNTSLFFY